MYCEKLNSTPTTSRLSRSLICAINFCLVRPRGHWSNGFKGTKNSTRQGTVRIGAVLTATLLRKHRPHRIVAPDDVADARNGLYTAVQRDRRRHHPANPKVALFQLRQKLGAQPRAEQPANCEECYRYRGGQTVMTHGER